MGRLIAVFMMLMLLALFSLFSCRFMIGPPMATRAHGVVIGFPNHVGITPSLVMGTFIIALPILLIAFVIWIGRKSSARRRQPTESAGPGIEKLLRDIDRLEDRIGNIETIMMDRRGR